MAKRGPKTVAGKQVVRHNAVSHGVSSESPVIPGVESEEAWQKFRAAWVESLEPVGFIEEQFAEATALLWWRRRRAQRYERDAATLRLAAADGDVAIAGAFGPTEAEYEEDRETLATLERGERLLRGPRRPRPRAAPRGDARSPAEARRAAGRPGAEPPRPLAPPTSGASPGCTGPRPTSTASSTALSTSLRSCRRAAASAPARSPARVQFHGFPGA